MAQGEASGREFLYGSATGLSVVALASYFDVYSHSRIFVGTDPWWNPAHLMLYSGFAVLAYSSLWGRPYGVPKRLSTSGVAVVLVAAALNEIWHRVLLFGNPIPEPFPVEPPHALLAVGLILIGAAALLQVLERRPVASDVKGRVAVAFLCGSMWLITGGSALYVGGAYGNFASYMFALGAASFTASLFLALPTALSGRFGYTTLAYLWFLSVYYLFFVSPADGLPIGVGLVLMLDFILSRRRIGGVWSRYALFPIVAVLYGVVYYPILPSAETIAVNAGLAASAAGVLLEFSLEVAYSARVPAEPIPAIRPDPSRNQPR